LPDVVIHFGARDRLILSERAKVTSVSPIEVQLGISNLKMHEGAAQARSSVGSARSSSARLILYLAQREGSANTPRRRG
jgi:hypothetical protein